MTDASQFNPLDRLNLGKSVAEALLDRPTSPLGDLTPFVGAGIYAIYYRGSFKAYGRLAARNAEVAEWPIYLGKAIPSGGRTGAAAAAIGRHLYNRLAEHAESVELATNLTLADFDCRYLNVDDIWIPLAETLLIGRFRPVWNVMVAGFGNHDPGAGRYKGLIPLWDVLHPGRPWAARLQPRDDTSADLAAQIAKYLKETEPPPNPHITF